MNNRERLTHWRNDQEDASTENDGLSMSLLSLLDDKNKIIAELQQRLQNQKEQLTYYLGKELRTPKVLRLAETCCPRVRQDSIVVNLAMNRLGIKSDVCALYERMCLLDDRLTASLQDQEFVLRKIVVKLCEFVKYANGKIEFRLQFSNFITDPFHIDLFNGLLNATMQLRNKLDAFRICCSRLMVVEDERNSIVEQIYSLPAEQRMNSNYIVGIQMEKMQLENEIKQILREQREERERIKELNVIEEKLSNLQRQLNSAFSRTDESSRINKMLQKVNFEAKILLDLTKEQRRRYENEMLKSRNQRNVRLEIILLCVRLASRGEAPDEKELTEKGITSKEDRSVYECIKKEIDGERDKTVGKMFDEMQARRRECENVSNKLNQAVSERNELKMSNVQLQRDISEMRLNQSKELAKLKQERDTYKSQVEDLEAIREAYAQLVDRHQPFACRMETEYVERIGDMDRQINELEKHNINLTQKQHAMKSVINKQHKEIKLQSEIIEGLKEQIESLRALDNSSTIKYVSNKPDTQDSGAYCSPRDTILTDDLSGELAFDDVYEEEILVAQEINWMGKSVFDAHRSAHSNTVSKQKVVEDIKNHIKEKAGGSGHDNLARWTTGRKQGAEDIPETKIEASLEGNLEKERSQPIDCSSKTDEGGDKRIDKMIDEYELMRDRRSRRTVPLYAPSRTTTRVAVGKTFRERNADCGFQKDTRARCEYHDEIIELDNVDSKEINY